MFTIRFSQLLFTAVAITGLLNANEHHNLTTDTCLYTEKSTVLQPCAPNGQLVVGNCMTHRNIVQGLPLHNIADIWDTDGWDSITKLIIDNPGFFNDCRHNRINCFASDIDAGKKIAEKSTNLEVLTIYTDDPFFSATEYFDDLGNFVTAFIKNKPTSLKKIIFNCRSFNKFWRLLGCRKELILEGNNLSQDGFQALRNSNC